LLPKMVCIWPQQLFTYGDQMLWMEEKMHENDPSPSSETE
jgi:hypothetical protein